MIDDATLVADALARGPEGFAPVVQQYKEAVFGVALVRLRNFHDAEDIAQTVFLEALERLQHLKDPNRLGAWLRSITIHRCIDYLRHQRHTTNPAFVSAAANHRLTPQEELERRELRERVLAAIERLSNPQRETVTLYYISGYKLQEIAAMQEVPVGTVKYRLHEARKKLKQDMMDMVAEVLKDGAPKQEFAERVFVLLHAYPKGGAMWRSDIVATLKRIGNPGIDGFIKALNLPHWQTRRAAVHYLGRVPATDRAVDLLIEALTDRNRRVRTHAVASLLFEVDIPEERRQREIIPLVAERLLDHSPKVRHFVAGRLNHWAQAVPLDVVARALRREQEPDISRRLQNLLLDVLEAQGIVENANPQ